MNQLEQLKSELQEKEKGCGTEIIDKVSCGDKLGTFVTQWLCPSCKAEISALKKGISACEEILNSQQNKMTSNQGMVSNPNLTEVNRTTGSADTEQEKAEGVVYPKGDSDTSPAQTLMKEMSHYKSRCVDLMCENDELKQALSNRNKEILEIVDKLKIKHTKEHRGCGDPSECCFNRLDVLGWDFFEDLKKQLTTEGEGKE